MDKLKQINNMQLDRADTRFVRYLHDEIKWDTRLVALLGARGVGKTTMLLQHIILSGQRGQSLLVFADDLYFANHTLVDLASDFYKEGGKYLYVDEIHKYRNWSTEIKNIYDQLPDLHVVYTGSSIMELEKGGADLSRRQLKYHLQGMSFREWLHLSKGIVLPVTPLDRLLAGEIDFPFSKYRPLPLFKEYLVNGYFPFCGDPGYLDRIVSVVGQTLENDIPQFASMSVGTMHKLRSLMGIITQISPFKPNYSDLARDLEVNRADLKDMLFYLEKSGMIACVAPDDTGLSRLAKTEKIYLDNTNLVYALGGSQVDVGNLRETAFVMMTRVRNEVYTSPVSDFTIGDFTFEVGGRKKGKKQLGAVDNGYVVKDDIEYATTGVIPLWALGLGY